MSSLDLLRAYDQCTLLHCTVERASHKKGPQWKVITLHAHKSIIYKAKGSRFPSTTCNCGACTLADRNIFLINEINETSIRMSSTHAA